MSSKTVVYLDNHFGNTEGRTVLWGKIFAAFKPVTLDADDPLLAKIESMNAPPRDKNGIRLPSETFDPNFKLFDSEKDAEAFCKESKAPEKAKSATKRKVAKKKMTDALESDVRMSSKAARKAKRASRIPGDAFVGDHSD